MVVSAWKIDNYRVVRLAGLLMAHATRLADDHELGRGYPLW
ncbi:DUF5609 domain-containing protein [Sodalis-like endosymbiont of Proechinophthirus fluctus]|nr:DUF5609 domain-containing protein [Sodalis-like endosymbiont of Proechinophthirus fluctus]